MTAPAYRWLHRVGEGAFGEVWAAERQGEVVAVKVVRGADEGSPARDALQRELAVGTSLAGLPGVVVPRAVLEIRGVVHLEMELVRGPNLEAVLDGWRKSRGAPLPASVAIPWMVEVLRTLHEAGSLVAPAHPESFVHRDIKPANLLLDPSGRLRITDFGVARALDLAGVHTTTTGIVKGTPRFMAPEVARGTVADGRADQFSVAAVLLELVTGRPLYAGPSVVHVLEQVARAEVGARVDELGAGAFAEVVARMLSRDPGLRYPTRAAAADALAQVRAEGPQLAALLPELLSYTRRDEPQLEPPEADAATDPWGGAEQTWETTVDTLNARVTAQQLTAPPDPLPVWTVGSAALAAVVGVALMGAAALAVVSAAAALWWVVR